jgi:RHS repeat-associated protein
MVARFQDLTLRPIQITRISNCTQESLSVTALSNNQITASGFNYDAAGNETSDVTSSYVWNAESQTKTAGGVNYTYDGDGDRVEKSNGTLYWYGAGSQVLMETGLSGSLTSEYVYFGGKRVARRDASNDIYYYADDMLGSSRAITTATGTVCYNADFYPYGGERAITNTCAQNYKFESKERDAETTNDDFGARYYASAYGRFISADWSATPTPVPYANLTNPQTLNLYAMVRDNPETFADLDGHILSSWFYAAAGTNEFPLTKDDPALNRADFIPEYENPEPPPPDPAQSQAVGNTTVGALEKTMTNEVGSLSTPKKGDPDVLVDAKTALANALINNANLNKPNQVAPATGTASTQDAQIMRGAATDRAKGGADPVEGRTYFGTTHDPNLQSRSAGNKLKGEAGRETVYEKFGPFKDSTSRRPTWIVIYNNPGH